MFQVNDFIFCGGNGVCKIVGIEIPTMGMCDKSSHYYKLQPIYENGSTVYIPVNNDKVIMRRIISKEDAQNLIDNITSIETLSFDDEKMCEHKYKECMHKYDCVEWIKIIKTSYLRNKERSIEGKKSTSTDDKYLKMAEEYLFGELAISFDMPKEEIGKIVKKQIKTVSKSEETES